jgi:predicted phosphodiesterase
VQISLQHVIKDAMEISYSEFIRLADTTIQQLKNENGKIGKIEIYERLVKIKPSGDAVIVSDLHGDLSSLAQILRESKILERMEKSRSSLLIFLGDYGDRGPLSPEVYCTVLRIKLQYPAQVVLMRGNHEGPTDLWPSPHDMPAQFQARFGKRWRDIYSRIVALFEHLYISVLVEDRYLMVHGGLPSQARSLEDFASAYRKHPKRNFLEDILWGDPSDFFHGTRASPRGAGKLFGKDVTTKVLKALNVRVLIRGHEPCDQGFKVDHDGMMLTLFSRKGPPYFNSYGAYLDMKLSRNIQTSQQLVQYIHKF